MPSLVVLCGHVGCGKTTLVKSVIESNPQIISADVYKYIQKYKDENGRVSDEHTAKAYEELYENLTTHNQDTILEIGVRHSDFNFQNLSKLKDRFNVVVIFCLLGKDICRQRVIDRAAQDSSRFINMDAVEAKFKIPFPEEHYAAAINAGIEFKNLDMTKTQGELQEFVLNLFV